MLFPALFHPQISKIPPLSNGIWGGFFPPFGSYSDLEIEVEGRTRIYDFLVTALGKQRLILGLPWLEEENPEIDWKEQKLTWRYNSRTIYAILDPIIDTKDVELVISFVGRKLTEQAKDDWVKTRMSHSQLFAVKEERAKEKPADQIVPKEFHKFLNTVFSEREVGTLPKRRPYDHKIQLKEGFKPMIGPLFRQSTTNDEIAKEFIAEHLEKGFIRPSEFPSSLHVILCTKERWTSTTRTRLSISQRRHCPQRIPPSKD